MVYATPSVDQGFAQQVLFRLYCINRLRPAIKIIKQLTSEQLFLIDRPMIHLGGIYKDKTVLQLWGDVKHYKYLHDAEFFPYMLWRVLLVLVQTKKIPDVAIHKDFDGINVEDFLSAIDVVVSHAHQINQHYHNSGLPFYEWVKQYWWIPALFSSTIFIKVLKYYYLDSENDFAYTLRSSSKNKGF